MRSILCLAVVLFSIMYISCNAQQHNKTRTQIFYEEGKASFGESLATHFPKVISSTDSNFISRAEREEFNDISFFLYEYNLSNNLLEKVLLSLKTYNPVGEYKSTDTCLLIVNRFENKATYDNFVAPKITDSSLINRDCYTDLLPIANFIEYKGKSETSCGLDSTFIIYVLEAKPEKPFSQFDLKPFKHMPKKWANGFSRGIAISKEDKTVIYWSIVW